MQRHWWKINSNRECCRVMTITPEMAKEAIEYSIKKQRQVKPYLVDRLARSMSNRAWRLTHMGIAFTASGINLDGQHRLRAIVKSGVTVKMRVFFNQPDENFACIDTGGVRTNQDAVYCAGLEVFKTQSSVIRTMFLTSRCRNRIENEDILKLTELLGDGLQFLAKHLFHLRMPRVCTAQMGANILRAYYKHPGKRDLLARFCDLVHDPVGARCTDAEMGAYKLREWLNQGAKRMQGDVIDEYRRINTSLHLFLSGVVQERLCADKEEHFCLPNEPILLQIADNASVDDSIGYFIVPLCKRSCDGVESTPLQRFSAAVADRKCRMPNTIIPPKDGDKVVFVAKQEGRINGKVVGMAVVNGDILMDPSQSFPAASTSCRTKYGDPQPIEAALRQVKAIDDGPFLAEVAPKHGVKVDRPLVTSGARIDAILFNALTMKLAG